MSLSQGNFKHNTHTSTTDIAQEIRFLCLIKRFIDPQLLGLNDHRIMKTIVKTIEILF